MLDFGDKVFFSRIKKILKIIVLIVFLISFCAWELTREHNYLEAKNIILPDKSFSNQWNTYGYVKLEGVWQYTNTKNYKYPSATEIFCYKDKGYCEELKASLNFKVLSASLKKYPITSLSGHHITYVINASCNYYENTINLNTGNATAVRYDKNKSGFCEGLEAGNLYLKLEDGYTVSQKITIDNINFIDTPIYALMGIFSKCIK